MTDWPVKTLGDVCEVIAGQSPEGKFYNKEGKGVPFYQGKKDFAERVLGSPTTWTSEVTKLARPGDILMSVRAPVGPVNLCPIEACIGRGLAAIRPSSKTDTDFIYYYLESIQSEIAGTEGAVFASINKSQIEGLRCPVPPLQEQKRIVALLDAATERVTECTEVTSTEIRLASNLYQARVKEILSAHALKGVREVALASLVELVIDHRGKTPNKLGGDFTNSGVPVVSAIHIKDDSIKWSERYRYVTFEMFERWMPVRLMKGDILLTSEAPLGQVARIESDDPLVLSQRLFALRANSSLVSGDYLFEFLRSPFGQELLKARATGATAVGIRQAELMKVMVPVPRLEDQPEMIREIQDARRAILDFESQLRERDLRLKNLRQSILEAAFSGGL